MTRAYEEIVTLIANGSTWRDVAEFQPSVEVKARVEALIRKEKSEGLSPEESLELHDCVQLEYVLRMAKARVRKNFRDCES